MLNYDRARELLRAKFVIEKAEREGDDVHDSLRNHFVAQSIAEELTGESSEYIPKKKAPKAAEVLLQWAKDHVGATTCPADIATDTGLSYATANKFVGERRDWFHKIKKGEYIVRDADLERMEE